MPKTKKHIVLNFGSTIRYLRNQLKITQEEFAERAGFHRTYIGQIERGERNPTLSNIEIFASTFNLSLSDLFKLYEELNNKGSE